MTNEMHLDARARADLYHFLSVAFLGPMEHDALRQITDRGILDQLDTVLGEAAVEELRNFSAAHGLVVDTEGLAQEYMDLFAAPTGRYVVPFEDVYRGAAAAEVRGPLLGEYAIGVKRLYQAAGAEIDDHCKELPTHIGVELGFMSFLCSNEAAASSGEPLGEGSSSAKSATYTRYRELQACFLEQHLNAWCPMLSRAIDANAVSGFYRGLARLTESLVARDTARLTAGTPDARLASTRVGGTVPKSETGIEGPHAG